MKVFKKCDRRNNGKCVQFRNRCVPGLKLPVQKCWRMCEENKQYLQCPECVSGLWFDNYTNSLGLGDIFYCPKCDKNINRSKAVQSIERLKAELRKAKRIVSDYEKSDITFPSPRQCDAANNALYKIQRLREMIVELIREDL